MRPDLSSDVTAQPDAAEAGSSEQRRGGPRAPVYRDVPCFSATPTPPGATVTDGGRGREDVEVPAMCRAGVEMAPKLEPFAEQGARGDASSRVAPNLSLRATLGACPT